MRDHNEKLAIAKFPQFTVPTLVTRQEHLIRDFLAEHGDIVLKPLDGMGGASVFRIHSADHNIGVIMETLTHYGTRTIMAQRYIPEITQGDKRILLIAGEPVPYSLHASPSRAKPAAILPRAVPGWRSRLRGATVKSLKHWVLHYMIRA